jgi:hypothetical protein
MRYLEVAKAGRATDFSPAEPAEDFGRNFHVHQRRVLNRQKTEKIAIRALRDKPTSD